MNYKLNPIHKPKEVSR